MINKNVYLGKALKKASTDQKINYMEEVATDFCSRKEIVLKYSPITEYVCRKMFDVR